MSDYEEILSDLIAYKKARVESDKARVFIEIQETRKENQEILISLEDGTDWDKRRG